MAGRPNADVQKYNARGGRAIPVHLRYDTRGKAHSRYVPISVETKKQGPLFFLQRLLYTGAQYSFRRRPESPPFRPGRRDSHRVTALPMQHVQYVNGRAWPRSNKTLFTKTSSLQARQDPVLVRPGHTDAISRSPRQ